MILMLLLGVLCAAVFAFALHPLMRENARAGWAIMAAGALLSLGLYLLYGSPDLPAAPAAFETAGPRHDQRLNAQRELIIMEALAGQPDNVKLLLELGVLRIDSPHPEEALALLERADTLSPENPQIREALGAAHYKLALIYKMQPRPEAQRLAAEHLRKALTLTPKDTDLYNQLKSQK